MGAAEGAAAADVLVAAAFTVGLDQQVRCWPLRLGTRQQQHEHGELGSSGLEAAQQAPGSLPGAACYQAHSSSSCSSGSPCSSLEVVEAGCCFTQVVEPAALDVLLAPLAEAHSSGGTGSSACRQYLLGVAGRGTELLTWCLPPR
jgi:hypothetical protein